MFKRSLVSQKGFGFADVLGAFVIVTVSLTALFMIILSSKIRVTNDYHYRKALLASLSKMETVKYRNRGDFNGNLVLGITGLEDNVVLDESYRPVLDAETKISVKTKTAYLSNPSYFFSLIFCSMCFSCILNNT